MSERDYENILEHENYGPEEFFDVPKKLDYSYDCEPFYKISKQENMTDMHSTSESNSGRQGSINNTFLYSSNVPPPDQLDTESMRQNQNFNVNNDENVSSGSLESSTLTKSGKIDSKTKYPQVGPISITYIWIYGLLNILHYNELFELVIKSEIFLKKCVSGLDQTLPKKLVPSLRMWLYDGILKKFKSEIHRRIKTILNNLFLRHFKVKTNKFKMSKLFIETVNIRLNKPLMDPNKTIFLIYTEEMIDLQNCFPQGPNQNKFSESNYKENISLIEKLNTIKETDDPETFKFLNMAYGDFIRNTLHLQDFYEYLIKLKKKLLKKQFPEWLAIDYLRKFYLLNSNYLWYFISSDANNVTFSDFPRIINDDLKVSNMGCKTKEVFQSILK